MEILPLAFLAFSMVVAYILKSITGIGTSIILVPALAYIFDIRDAIVLVAISDIVSSAILILQNKEHVTLSKLKEVGIGLFIGTFFGVLILNAVSQNILKLLLAVFIGIYLIIQYFNPIISLTSEWTRKMFGYVFGFIGGICGGVFNTNGPAIFMYVKSAFPSRESIRTNLFFLFFFDSLWRTGLFAYNGMVSAQTVITFLLLLLPGMLLGLAIGKILDQKIQHSHYTFLSQIVLVISGIKLLFR